MKKKVLIIDKSMSYSLFLEKVLLEEGFAVQVLHSVRNLTPLERMFNYEAIFMDINEYIIGGLPFIKGIKILQPNTRIIFTSENGTHNKDMLKRAMDNGVYGCIHKPFNREEITAIVDGLTGSQRRKNPFQGCFSS
ncbi:MAG: response regulator [Candidatus Omnitrophota bacterium]